MWIYYLMFSVVIGLYYITEHKTAIESKNELSNNKHNVYSNIVLVLLILIMGLRSTTVGIDLHNYEIRYVNSEYLWREYRWEKGYSFIGYVFNNILHFNFQWYLFIISAMIIAMVLHFINCNSSNAMISLVVYLTIGNFTMNMSGLRQSIAMTITLFSLDYIKKRKFGAFLILVLIAFSIHNSAIGFLPVYFLYGLKLTKKKAWYVLFALMILLPFRNLITPIVKILSPEKYQEYSLTQEYSINILVILVPIVICVYFLIHCPLTDNILDENNSFYYLFSLISIFMLTMTSSNVLLGRLSYYYNYGLMIIAPAAVKEHMNINRKNGLIVGSAMVVLLILYFLISTPGGTLQIDNYKFYWQY